jgi:hypothetical protein
MTTSSYYGYQAGKSNANSIRNYFSEPGDNQLQIGFDEYGRRIITTTEGNTAAYQRFIYVTPDEKDFAIASRDQIITKFKKDFGGDMETLRESLYRKGFLTEKDYVTKSGANLNGAILVAANEQSIELAESMLYDPNNTGTLKAFNNWLNARPDYVGGAGPTDRAQAITKADANQMLDAFTIDMLSREATPAERKDFYDRVSAEMKKAVVKNRTSGNKTITSGSLLDEQDYQRLLSETIKPAVRGTNLESLASGTGSIAQGITSLKNYAASYGIRLNTQEALDDIMGGMVVGGTLTTGKLEQQQQKIRNMSKAFYGNLSDSIDAGVSIKNIASQFANLKGQILEMNPESIDVFDKDIQAALRNNGKAGVMTQTDFEILLRGKPEWSKTKNARDEAAGYANDVLKMMGLVG